MNETRLVLKIKGMDCDGCAQTIGRALKRIDGVRDVQIDWQAGEGEVSFDATQTSEEAILDSPVFTSGYEATVA